jgi:hypothetical protein
MAKGTYYWCVKAHDPAGNWSNWSASWSITIRPLIPVAPVLTSPVAGLVTNDNTPGFAWNPVPYGDTYEIQIDDTSSFTVPVEQSAAGLGLTYTANPALSMTGLKYWHVRAVNVDGELGAWSSARAITIKVLPPSVPALVAPANNALVTTLTPTLDWSQPTIASGTTFGSYRVEVSADAGFSSIAANTTLTSLGSHLWVVAPALDPNTPYYWHVKACNTSAECSAWSSVRIFRTAIAKPTLSLPGNGTHPGSKPLFDWDDPAGASNYTLVISKNAGFTSLVGTYSVTLSTYTPSSNLPVGTLYWRVRANGLNGPSLWSDVWTLIVP